MNKVFVVALAPATPITTLEVDTTPSLAPSTAALRRLRVAFDIFLVDFPITIIVTNKIGRSQRIMESMQEILVKIMADGAVIPVTMIGIWALLFKVPAGHRYKAYCRILLAGLTAYLFAKLIGGIYQPELQRPFEQLGVAAGASYLNNPGFPSDHVLFCTAITLAVWLETRDKVISWILVGLTCMVAIGRILALVHSPLDVTGGAVIACLGAFWYIQREPFVRKPLRKVKQWSKPLRTDTLVVEHTSRRQTRD